MQNNTPPLWPHQEKSVQDAVDKPSWGIWSGMGSGKSRVAVEVVRRRGHRRVLIVCPKSVLDAGVWAEQFEKYMPEHHHMLEYSKGSTALKSQMLAVAVQDLDPDPSNVRICVFNYDSVWRDPLGERIIRADWDLVILDEAHRIKAAGSKVSRFMARLGRSKFVKQKLALTGTPTPNSPLDVYGLYRFLDADIFGTNYQHFSTRYAIFGGFNNYQVKQYVNLGELGEKMASISTRFRTEDVIDLPPVIDIYRGAELNGAGRKHYRDIEKNFITDIAGSVVTASTVLVKSLRLQQIVSGFLVPEDGGAAVRIGTEKMDLLLEALAEIPTEMSTDSPNGIYHEKVVVFYRFTSDLYQIRHALIAAGYLVGEISGAKNDYKLFKAGTFDVLLVQEQAGSEGIDLSMAAYAIYYSPVWDLGRYDQGKARVHRPGQTRTTRFIHLYIKDSIDETMYKALRDKANVVERVMAAYLDPRTRGLEEPLQDTVFLQE